MGESIPHSAHVFQIISCSGTNYVKRICHFDAGGQIG